LLGNVTIFDSDCPYCGNGIIDDGETCSSCSADAGACPVVITTNGGSGGGSGGGVSEASKFEKSEASYELLRGKETSFTFELKNKYSQIMKNIKISVGGLNSEYISIIPDSIIELAPGENRTIKITINAPAYFSGKKYDLIFDITSSLVDPATPANSIASMDKRYITLYIVEVEKGNASILLNESLKFIKEMNNSNLITKEARGLLDEARKAYENRDYLAVKTISEKIKIIHDNALEAKSIIENLKEGIKEAQKNGISTLQTQKVLAVAEVAFARGDYALALQRLNEAKLVYALEVKGEFNFVYAVKNNPGKSFSIALFVGIASWVSSLLIRLRLYKKKLRVLSEEELLLLELMKMIQRQCFQERKMSMEEYDQAMMQYESKLSETIENKIRTETKIANILRFRGKRKALNEEKERLIGLIRKAQDDYLNKGKVETRVYENMIKSYTSRLGEVDEQIAYLDAQDAMKSDKKLSKEFKIGR
jgi:hypothetical protein